MSGTKSDKAEKDTGELTALQAALSAEHAAVYGYGVVGGLIGEARRSEARAAYDAHRARRDELARAVRALGGTPVAAAAGYALPFPVTDSEAAVRLAAELEDRVAGVYSDLVRAAGGTGRRTGAEGLREAAVRAVRWRGGSVPFPGLAERAGTASAPATASPSTEHRVLEGNDSRMAFEPPPRLVRALAETAPDGDDWLARVPAAAQQAVDLRVLTVERVQVPGGRSSLVVLVRRSDGTPAVLKLAPRRARPESERVALAHWGGAGAVQLLEASADSGDFTDSAGEGVLLLERLHPDVSVRSLPEAKALLEAAGTLRRLWVEPPAGSEAVFETVASRTGRQAEVMSASAGADAEVAPLVAAALAAREELLVAPPEARLLHGTFRQSKVLAAERVPWLAVGPDPVVGECAFDLARLVRDRVEDLIASSSGAAITRRRVKRLAESLDVDQERLRGWTLFRAVESGVRALRVGRPRDAELLLEFAGWL